MLSDWINLPLQHLCFWKLPFISFSLFDFIKGLLKFYSNQKPFPDVSPTEHSSWGVTCVCVYYINTAHEPSAPWASQLQQKKRRRQPEHHLTVSNWIKYWTDANLWECYRAIITSPIGLEKKTCTVSFFLLLHVCVKACTSLHVSSVKQWLQLTPVVYCIYFSFAALYSFPGSLHAQCPHLRTGFRKI